MLNRWIPKEKREKGKSTEDLATSPAPQAPIAHASFIAIPGVDTAKGIAMTGGTPAAYRQVLALFSKDAQERLSLLQKPPEAETLPVLVTHVHALKSASASLGADNVSAGAAGLEAAGKAGNMAFIRKNLPAFARQLADLVKEIDAALKTENNTDGQAAPTADDSATLFSLLYDLKPALETQKTADIDRILEELNQKSPDAHIREALEKISDDVLMAEYGKAAEILDDILRGRNGR
jgi:HPt (histidine-containing phosphotransfer) domain-containing protein